MPTKEEQLIRELFVTEKTYLEGLIKLRSHLGAYDNVPPKKFNPKTTFENEEAYANAIDAYLQLMSNHVINILELMKTDPVDMNRVISSVTDKLLIIAPVFMQFCTENDLNAIQIQEVRNKGIPLEQNELLSSLAIMPVQRAPRYQMFGKELSRIKNDQLKVCADEIIKFAVKFGTKMNIIMYNAELKNFDFEKLIKELGKHKNLSHLRSFLKEAMLIIDDFSSGKSFLDGAARVIKEDFEKISKGDEVAFANYIIAELSGQEKRVQSITSSEPESPKSQGSQTSESSRSTTISSISTLSRSKPNLDIETAAKHLAKVMAYINVIVEQTAKPAEIQKRSLGIDVVPKQRIHTPQETQTMQEIRDRGVIIDRVKGLQGKMRIITAMAKEGGLSVIISVGPKKGQENSIIMQAINGLSDYLLKLETKIANKQPIDLQAEINALREIHPRFQTNGTDLNTFLAGLNNSIDRSLSKWMTDMVNQNFKGKNEDREDLIKRIRGIDLDFKVTSSSSLPKRW